MENKDLESCVNCKSKDDVQFDACIGAPFDWFFGVMVFCENCGESTGWKDAKNQLTGTNDDKEIENLYMEAAIDWAKKRENMKFKNIKTFDRKELSNEEYHTEEYKGFLSGSYLFKLIDDCPAAAEYAEHKDSKALHFGTASHTAFLEPEEFAKEYYRIPCAADYPDALPSDTAIKAFLKQCGVKGYTTKKGVELYELVTICEPEKKCLADIKIIEALKHSDKEGLSAADFDQIMLMRDTLLSDPANAALAMDEIELSIFGEVSFDEGETWHKIKVRLDMLCNGQITDYKTTGDASPQEFGKSAYRFGYYLKMALQYDLACAFKDEELPLPILLAQSKNSPYIAQAYRMTEEQIKKGREQYSAAIRIYTECKKSGFWAYGGGVQELQTPPWAKD